jgi:hypothetical protein
VALAYENDPNSDQFTDTSAGGLVDVIDSRMQFSSMLSNGNAGLLRALDPMRGGEELDGIGPYSPDSDSPYDIAVLATLAENKPMALKRRGKQSLATLHGFFEQGDRYDAVTGRNSFRSLSRLMIGLSSAAVDSTHSAARMSTAQNGFRSRELDDEGALDTIVALIDTTIERNKLLRKLLYLPWQEV